MPVDADQTPTRPPALRPGDRVAVCAPSGPVNPARLTRGLGRLAERYRVECGPGVFSRQGYLAGGDERRAEELDRALRDPDIRAIFCTRGGYGVTRILPLLDPQLIRADPKPICGFSDITALLQWALAAGVVAVHGPVVTQLGTLDPESCVAHLFRLLEDPGYRPELRGRPGVGGTPVHGPLQGGNLALLAALAGTSTAPRLRRGILLVEEIGEAPYRIDRMLTQLAQQAGAEGWGGLAGVGVGSLIDCRPVRAGGPTALAVIAERLGAGEGRPCVVDLPFGHGALNRAFPLGVMATLDPKRGSLALEGGAVGPP